MASSVGLPLHSAPLHSPITEIPNKESVNEQDVSNSSSTASSVLIRSTNPPTHQAQTNSDRRSSTSSSFSSTGSQRVRIKAKYLREVKSPFDADEEQTRTDEEFVPPILPKNLPQGREIEAAYSEDNPVMSNGRPERAEPVRVPSGGSVHVHKVDVPHESAHIGPASLPKPSSFGSLLKQGAPTSSHTTLSMPSGPANDVKITQFAAGGKQRVFKEQLLKRQEGSGPVKRYVRPTMVVNNPGTSQVSAQEPVSKTMQDVSDPNAVAAVAAAAVAATLPIVKAQSDLESKLDAMMERLGHLHELTNSKAQQLQQPAPAAVQQGDQAGDPQRNLDDMVSRRLLHLEKIQERQLEWQERFLMRDQHPAQRHEGLHSSTEPTRLGRAPVDLTHRQTVINGVRSGMTDQSAPVRDTAQQSHMSVGQHEGKPSLQRLKQGFDQNGRHVPQSEDRLSAEDHNGIAEKLNQETERKSQKRRHYTPAVTLHRHASQSDPLAKQNLQSEAVPSSDNDADIGHGYRRAKPSPLDTPAPRRHAPQPLTQNPPPKITRTGRGLLEEILTSHDEEERRLATRGRQTHTPPTVAASHCRGLASPQSGAETKAASLVQQLGKLKMEMREMKTDLLQNLHSGGAHVEFDPRSGHLPPSRGHSELHEEAEREWDKLIQRRLQPAPADIYLRKPPHMPVSYPAAVSAKQPLSPSQYNAPVHSSMCTEAKAVLDKVQSSRAHLESNLETVIRAKEQEEFYNYLDSLHQEGEAAEKAKLRYKVGRMIASLDEELKHELNKPKKPHPSVHIPEKDATVPAAQPLKAGGRKKPVSARIDSGMSRGQPPTAAAEKGRAREKYNKENVATAPKRQPVSRAKKPHPVDHNQDEAYLTRVYGKALYQARRSTIQKEPYLKYATASPQAKPARTPSATLVKGIEMKSARIQTEPSSRTIQIPRPVASQFYFDPYPGVPTTSGPHPQADANPSRPGPDQQPAPLTAPSHGQLIPMAVPLGPPQMGGLAQPVTIKTEGLETGVIRDLERREIRTNVAVVNVESKTKPQLTVQHLPPVDIDTAPPSVASSIMEYGPAHDTTIQQDTRADITQPDDDNLPGVKGPAQFSHYLAVSDTLEPKEESEDDLPVPGISLPGNYTETTQRYHGPPFPPQAPPADPSWARPSSDQLAGDIRRDIMENTAMEWVERELMARMISELYSRPPAVEQRPVSPDPSLDSSTNDSIVETIGPAGLQLFVDAGQAVDRTLVNALVREVLEEKVATALGQHDRDVPRQRPTSTLQEALTDMTTSPIPTPLVTPKASPVHTPPRVASRVATPVASPSEASPAESETESVKEPLPTHDTTTADETIAAPSAPVATPTNTPPPSPPPSIDTPASSLRESPKLISVIDGSVITPVRTPESVSPEPVEEVSVELVPPSPEPVPVIEERPPPTPTPSLPMPSTPTPTPSSVTTTQPTPSTETAGQTISEGEWLISAKSEGQVDDLTENEPGVVAMGNLSTSSSIDGTLMGAEDLEKDAQDDDKLSEGEISPAKHTPRLHTGDPVVALLAHMRQRPDPLAGPSGLLPPHLAASQTTLNDTKSLGEISVGQCPALTPSSEQLLFKEAYGAKPPEVITPRAEAARRSLGEVGTASEEQPETERQPVDDSTLRVSHLDGRERQEPMHKVDSPPGDQEAAHQATPHPAPRIIQVAGKPLSPEPPRKEDEQQPFREASRQDPADSAGVTDAVRTEEDNVRGDEPFRAPIPTNLFGTQTMSDLGTRTLTPDALNLEALLQSGYLSQTFSQSEAGTSDFESTRPGQTGGWAGASGTPFTEDSLERTDRKDSVAKTGRAMSFSVTLPSAAESQGLDLSQTISEGEIPAAETTSDISEISGGPL